MSPKVCWFLDAGNKEARHAQLTGVQKAPRHEVAGSWAPAEQRTLRGFKAGAALDGERNARTRRRAMSAYRGTEDGAVGVSAATGGW
jgi:hypothetical protein